MTYMYWCQDPNLEIVVRIDSIATRHIAGMDRRVFYVSSREHVAGAHWMWTNTWIEGIGATEGLLYSCYPTESVMEPHHELLCYHENGELLYNNPQYEDCIIDDNTTTISEETVSSVYYDPRSKSLRFLNEPMTVVLYDTLGREVFRKQSGSGDSICLSNLPNGLYFVKTTDTNGGECVSKVVKQ